MRNNPWKEHPPMGGNGGNHQRDEFPYKRRRY